MFYKDEQMHFNGLKPDAFAQIGQRGGTLMVVGDHESAVDEGNAVFTVNEHVAVMNINNAGRWGFKPDYVATQHGAVRNFIDTPRMPLEYIPDTALVFCTPCNGDQHERIDWIIDLYPKWGTSGMFGVLCGIWLGYSKIVTVGMPMSGGYGGESKLDNWRAWLPYIRERVEFTSGKLKEL